METLKLQSKDGFPLSLAIFHVQDAKGIVQIIHGAKEHKARYYHFAKFLQENGFAVIISDNRGHGESINEAYPLGFMNGIDEIIADQLLIMEYVKGIYPTRHLYLFGHSLGSVFARCFLQKHDAEIKKLILSGTVNYVPGVSLGMILGKAIVKKSGQHGYNQFLEKLSLKNQKDDSWISVNQKNLEAYRNDPLCQYEYQNQAVLTIFEGVRQLKNITAYQCDHPSLPILSISGAGDPITGGERGLRRSIGTLKKIGYSNIKNIVYPNMKHEVLNEVENDMVYKDILEFLHS